MKQPRSLVLLPLLLAALAAGCNDRPGTAKSGAETTAMSPPAAYSDPSLPKETPTLPANPAETADHAKADPDPRGEMTKREADAGMPKPGQNNDESSLALDAKK